MFKNLRDLTDFGSTGWVRVYQVWDAAGVVVAKVTAAQAREQYTSPQYQFALLHEVKL